MKVLSNICAVALLGLVASSCVTNSVENTETNQYPQCFAYVKNVKDNSEKLTGDITYTIALDNTKLKASITISGFEMPDGSAYNEMKFEDLPYTINDEGWLVVSSPELNPAVSTFKQPTVSNFEFRLLPRWVINSSVPGMMVRFMIDDCYFYSSQQLQVMAGVTQSTPEDGETYQTKVPYYAFYFDCKTQKVNIGLYQAQFAVDKFEQYTIVLPEVPFTMSENGAQFAIADITPSIAGNPDSGYKVTNVSGSFDFSRAFTLGYTIDTSTAQYTVTASGTYFSAPETAE